MLNAQGRSRSRGRRRRKWKRTRHSSSWHLAVACAAIRCQVKFQVFWKSVTTSYNYRRGYFFRRRHRLCLSPRPAAQPQAPNYYRFEIFTTGICNSTGIREFRNSRESSFFICDRPTAKRQHQNRLNRAQIDPMFYTSVGIRIRIRIGIGTLEDTDL